MHLSVLVFLVLALWTLDDVLGSVVELQINIGSSNSVPTPTTGGFSVVLWSPSCIQQLRQTRSEGTITFSHSAVLCWVAFCLDK